MSDKQNLPASYDPRLPGLRGAETQPAVDFQPPLDEGDGTGGAQLQRYVAAVLRFKWPILALVIVGTAAGILLGRNTPRTYMAEVTFYFSGSDAAMQGPTHAATLLQRDAWVSLVRSFSVLDPVVRDQKLYLEHDRRDAEVLAGFDVETDFVTGEYVLRVSNDGRTAELHSADGSLIERQAAGQPIGRSRGFIWVPPPQRLQAK
jgi:hypothetical protein